MRSSLCHIALTLALLGAGTASFAGPAEDAKALMARGQNGDALAKLDQHLSNNPQDANARFDRGVVLVRLNRLNEATKVFADLTRDYPQLPEPYNNLAAIYAQQGQYEKARDALEAALAAHPSYATAHENLGDIYAALAGAAYNRALLADQTNQGLRGKIAALGKIEHSPVTLPAKLPPVVAAKPALLEKPVIAPLAKEPVAAEPAPAKRGALDKATRDAVSQALVAWTRAWSAKDLPAYFAAYAENFAPEGGASVETWREQRKERISKPSRIQVEARNAEFSLAADGLVRIQFLQQYESDTFTDSVEKIIEMQRGDDGWKIIREYAR